MAIIKQYNNGNIIERRSGRFDEWCIYVNNIAPQDRDYFNQLLAFANFYGRQRIYTDFLQIYNNTGKFIDYNILNNMIPMICLNYNPQDRELAEILYATIYCTMVAEENKANTRLGKKIKGLAAHQILLEGMDIEQACNFSRGRNWREIDGLCMQRGLRR